MKPQLDYKQDPRVAIKKIASKRGYFVHMLKPIGYLRWNSLIADHCGHSSELAMS